MNSIEKIRQEIERRIKANQTKNGFPGGVHCAMRIEAYEGLLDFIDSLPEDTSCIYDTNKLTPTPSVNIEDVARVQFASHAHVFDRKRKAVFDWQQFKEVAGIFYGFGKRDSLPEEFPPYCTGFKGHPDPAGTSDLEEAAKEYADGIIHLEDALMCKAAFIAGAEWQEQQDLKSMAEIHKNGYNLCKEQMMKEAVEAKVWESGPGYRDLEMESEPFRKALEGFKDGDKVKLIIVKEDDKGRND